MTTNSAPPELQEIVYQLAATSHAAPVCFAAHTRGLSRSSDAGRTWQTVFESQDPEVPILVTSVAISGGGTTSMEYDYAGIRFKKTGPAGMFLYPFQGYEIDPSGTITKLIKVGGEILCTVF